MTAIESALGEFHSAVGDERVATADDPSVGLVVRPTSTEQVQECIRIAARHGLSVSANGGRYTLANASGSTVVLDLSDLNQITAYDARLASVTVGAGVTQEDLFGFLKSQGDQLRMDAANTSPGATVLEGVLRTAGGAQNSAEVGSATAYEVVMADGELLRTGTASDQIEASQPDARWAPGSPVEGLFSQADLGLVTGLSLALMPRPDALELVIIDAADRAKLAKAVDLVRTLRIDGTIQTAPWFGNSYRVLSAIMRYPWHLQPEPPLELELAHTLARDHGIAPYIGCVPLHGTARQVTVNRGRILALMRNIGIPVDVVDRDSLADAPNGARRSLQVSLYNSHTGGLVNDVRRTYWRTRSPIPSDMQPDRDGAASAQVSATVPLTGAALSAATTSAEDIVLRRGFEPMLEFKATGARTVCATLTVTWDQSIADQDTSARDAIMEVAEHWAANGWHAPDQPRPSWLGPTYSTFAQACGSASEGD